MTVEMLNIDKFLTNPCQYAESLNNVDLRKLLEYLKDLYYNTGNPAIDDATYDRIERLYENRMGKPAPVGAVVRSDDLKVKLPCYMGSLDKGYPDRHRIPRWLQTFPGPYVLSHKMDGISVMVIHDHTGKPSKLFKHGRDEFDGQVGLDVSFIIPFLGLPRGLPDHIVRGELIMSEEKFKKYSNEMKNARNMVSGLAGVKHLRDHRKYFDLDLVAYEIQQPRYKASQQFQLLEKMGYHVAPYELLSSFNIADLTERFDSYRRESPYKVDGVVICDDSAVHPGCTSGNPDYAFAFKVQVDEQMGETKVHSVKWNLSKHGVYKPTVILSPIQLGGTTIKACGGDNARYIVNNGIGPGAVVKIIRAGDVIPRIYSVITATEPQLPDGNCIWNDNKVDLTLPMDNQETPDEVLIRQLEHFVKTMGIKFFGKASIAKAVEKGFKDIESILRSDENTLGQAISSTKVASKILNEFSRIQDVLRTGSIHELAMLMDASGAFCAGIGTRKCKLVLQKYPQIHQQDVSIQDWTPKIQQLEGFSVKTSEPFVRGLIKFQQFCRETPTICIPDTSASTLPLPDNSPRVFKVRSPTGKTISVSLKSPVTSHGKTLSGATVVFTGFRDNTLQKKIENLGGSVSASVNSKTACVVTNRPDSQTVKINKARELGIMVLTPSEFQQQYGL